MSEQSVAPGGTRHEISRFRHSTHCVIDADQNISGQFLPIRRCWGVRIGGRGWFGDVEDASTEGVTVGDVFSAAVGDYFFLGPHQSSRFLLEAVMSFEGRK
jgi:hypothetical protein